MHAVARSVTFGWRNVAALALQQVYLSVWISDRCWLVCYLDKLSVCKTLHEQYSEENNLLRFSHTPVFQWVMLARLVSCSVILSSMLCAFLLLSIICFYFGLSRRGRVAIRPNLASSEVWANIGLEPAKHLRSDNAPIKFNGKTPIPFSRAAQSAGITQLLKVMHMCECFAVCSPNQ